MTSTTSQDKPTVSTGSRKVGFGIDVGGSGVKGARVDLDTGEFIGERIKILTPKPSTPEAIAKTVAEIISLAGWSGPVGITLPSVIKNQVAQTAANIDDAWIGTDTQELFRRYLGSRDVSVLNDADAAGIAEVAYGDPQARTGAALFLTFGTGIGSAMLIDGRLWPNSELGHLVVGKKEAEKQASSRIRDEKKLSYKGWAKKVSKVLNEYSRLLSPDVIIAGGGISRKHDKWIKHLGLDTPVIPARLQNRAGIVGAALAADEGLRP